MDNREDKLDILLDKLSRQRPELKDAEELTNNIMQKIRLKSIDPETRFLNLFRVVTSTAAVLLIGLFLYQQNEAKTDVLTHNSAPKEYKIDIDSTCIQHQTDKQVDLLETYYCYRQQNSIKNKQLQSFSQSLTN